MLFYDAFVYAYAYFINFFKLELMEIFISPYYVRQRKKV